MSTHRRTAAHPPGSGKGQVNGLGAYLTTQTVDLRCVTKKMSAQEEKKLGSPELKGGTKMATQDPPSQGRGIARLGRGNMILGQGHSPLNLKQHGMILGVDPLGEGGDLSTHI